MPRLVASLLAVVLLLGGGPGWSALFCACGDEPTPVCCCCDGHDEAPAGPILAARCDKVEVGREAVATPSGPVEIAPLAAPVATFTLPVAVVPARVVLASAPLARAPAPSGDPPYLRARSLRC